MRKVNADIAVLEAPGDVRLEGGDPVTQYAMTWLNAFPDARITVLNELVAGEWIAQEFTFEGTHTASLSTPMGDISATNRALKGRGAQIFRVEGDVVTDTRLYFDQVEVMTQLGLMPETAAAG